MISGGKEEADELMSSGLCDERHLLEEMDRIVKAATGRSDIVRIRCSSNMQTSTWLCP